jgi:tellurite resistance-related uncharacterized protein
MKKLTPVKRKFFSVDTLGTTSKVIDTESWLEDTLDRKKKRKEEGVRNKETLSLDIFLGFTLSKVKKKKTLSILRQDLDVGHLTMEIEKPTKEGRIEDMSIEDFALHSVDLKEVRHDTKVGLWKLTNDVIEGQLKSLKLAEVKIKAEIHELNCFIRQLVTQLASNLRVSTTRDATATNIQIMVHLP